MSAPKTNRTMNSPPSITITSGFRRRGTAGLGYAHGRRDVSPDQLGGLHEFRMRQRSGIHLKREPRDTSQRLVMTKDLLGHFVRATDQQGAVWASLSVEGRTRHRGPSAFLANVGDGASEARKEVVRGFLRRTRDVAGHMDADS